MAGGRQFGLAPAVYCGKRQGVTDLSVGDTIREKREAILSVAARHGATHVRLIGSVARGEARPDSDVDLLVEFLPEAEIGLLQHFAAERELSALLGRRVDLVSKRAVRKALMDEILPQAQLIYAA